MIDYQGFAIHHGRVLSGAWWSHTIGLYEQGKRPELFICGLTHELRVAWLLTLGFQMKGPPSARALEDEARARGIAVAELTYPAGGRTFEPGRIYRLAEGDLPGCFGVVERRYYAELLWPAWAYHGHRDFQTLQYVVSDPAGRFPWEAGCEERTRSAQKILFDPGQYLPLREEGA
jgi:hypothetical protein